MAAVWRRLPTAIQYECIPLILGGGDVLAAAETGSGKTGAFGLPILQVVHESIRSRQEGATSVSGCVPQSSKAFQTHHPLHHALLLAARQGQGHLQSVC